MHRELPRILSPNLGCPLILAPEELPGGLLPTGGAVITPGFGLRARYVVHCAGPIYDREGLDALAQPNTLPFWLTGICVGRDVAIGLGSLVIIALRGKRTFKPVLVGKASTICQVFLLYFVLYLNAAGRTPQSLGWIYVLTALLAVAGIVYAGFLTTYLAKLTNPNPAIQGRSFTADKRAL